MSREKKHNHTYEVLLLCKFVNVQYTSNLV